MKIIRKIVLELVFVLLVLTIAGCSKPKEAKTEYTKKFESLTEYITSNGYKRDSIYSFYICPGVSSNSYLYLKYDLTKKNIIIFNFEYISSDGVYDSEIEIPSKESKTYQWRIIYDNDKIISGKLEHETFTKDTLLEHSYTNINSEFIFYKLLSMGEASIREFLKKFDSGMADKGFTIKDFGFTEYK